MAVGEKMKNAKKEKKGEEKRGKKREKMVQNCLFSEEGAFAPSCIPQYTPILRKK